MARAPQSNRRNEPDARALTVQPARLPMPPTLANTEMGTRWKTLVDAVFPSAKTVDGVMLAIDYCKARGLDIMKKPVHVVPMWNSALGREVETVWPGIGDYRITAQRTGQWAGNDECEFGDLIKRSFQEKATRGYGQNAKVVEAACREFSFPEWARVTVYKIMAGQRVAFVGPKVYFMEIFSGEKGLRVPNARWQQAPRQMLEKCAEAAALRRAFPEELGNEYIAEEMEGKAFAGDPVEAARQRYSGQEAVQHQDPEPQAEAKPTRDSVRGWSDEIDELIERTRTGVNGSVEAGTATEEGLKDGKERYVDNATRDSWPEAALDELEKIFDDAIARLKGELPLSDEPQKEGEGEEATNDQATSD